MRYVLVIPGWFPSGMNFLGGDFIERHARAASLFFPVRVLYVVKDNSMPLGTTRLERDQGPGNYESFVYYYSARSPFAAMEKLASVWLQRKCLAEGYKTITRSSGQPSLLHAHVLVKHAWFALRMSKKHDIPLLASEQWTGYLPGAEEEFRSLSLFQRKTMKKVFNHAVHLTTVSDYLAKSMRQKFVFKDYTVIPNLVDTSIFKPEDRKSEIPTFIHISTLSKQKNFDEILEACAILNDKKIKYQLIVVSPFNAFYRKQVASKKLDQQVSFHEEIRQSSLAKLVATSDALILYSNYETFGCVIVEANACGVPVITSDYPVFNENVRENITGFRVPLKEPGSLADRMLKIINKQNSFDKQGITELTRNNYSFEVVGKQFADVYNRYAKP